MLLPAVQAARETARRIHCRANLKQLGLAVNTYHDTFKAFPASGVVNPVLQPGGYERFRPQVGRMFSWVVFILPFIEEQNLYDEIDFTQTIMNQPNEPQAVVLPLLQCPSDPYNDSFYIEPMITGEKRFAKGNYAAYVSPYHVEYQNWYPGALIGHRRQSLKHIVDGTSNTIALAEIRTLYVPEDQRGAWALPWAGASLLALDSHPEVASPPVGRPAPRFAYLKGTPMQMPNRVEGTDASHSISDSLFSCTGQHKATASRERMPCLWQPGGGFMSAAPRSTHPGGVHVMFLDGHVTLISNDISEPAMATLVSINDGQQALVPAE